MLIIDSNHSHRESVLAYSQPFVKKTQLVPEPVAIFISPHDALPLPRTYVTVQLVDQPEYKLAFFTTNLFYGVHDQCPYSIGNVICWKPCDEEGFHAIA